MKYQCPTCSTEVVRAREIDNNLVVVDAEEFANGPLVMMNRDATEPTVLWNVSPDGDAFWGIPANAPRFRRHHCPVR